MSDYKNLKGKKVKFLTSDLSNEQAEGQIFYSDTDNDFKSVVSSAAWSSGGNLVTATRGIANTGSVDASVAYGGYTTGNVATTLEYNGVGWASAADMPGNYPESSKGGTQTAVISTGGDSTNNGGAATREYDGTNWTAGGNLGTGRYALDGDGTQTAAFVCAGNVNPGSGVVPQTLTEEYNGTAWSESGDLSNARNRHSTAGLQTAGLAFGGSSDTPMTISATSSSTEEYDGSSWTSGGTMGTARYSVRGGGIQTNALAFGGNVPGKTANTELYNGTTWTEMNNLAVVTTSGGGDGLGTTKSWLTVGGATNPGNTNLSTTQEFHITTSTITGAAWASGGNTSHRTVGRLNFGTQTAAFAGGGVYVPNPGYTDESKTEEYDGSSWTAGTDMPADKGRGTGHGTLTAGLVCGGTVGNTNTNATFEYDGTNWTAGGNMNVARRYMGGFGIQTAAVICGGFPSPTDNGTETEEYNGSAWTAVTATPTSSSTFQASGGTLTAGIYFGGEGPPGAKTAESFEYDGTNWTAGGDLVEATSRNSGGGTLQTATMAVGGTTASAPPGSVVTQLYDGTSWRTSASMAVARSQVGAFTGTTSSGLINNGINASDTAIVTTEEFTAETTALNIKTLTDS